MSASKLSTGRQPTSEEGAQGQTTKKTRWKKSNWCVLCPTCHIFSNITEKRTTQTSFRWNSKCHDWERRKRQVEIIVVIQVHIPLVAAGPFWLSLTEVSWWRYQTDSLGWPEYILLVMIWCLNLSIALKSIAEVHVTSGFKLTTSFDKKQDYVSMKVNLFWDWLYLNKMIQARYKLNCPPASYASKTNTKVCQQFY